MGDQQPTRYQKCLVAFLYFVQGVFLVIPGTFVLTYKQMPDYSILALFSFAILPFSFKFVAAPLIEKYTLPTYGRRKTWVVLSLVIAGFFLILCTLFTQENQQNQRYLAFLLTGAIFMIALEDISTDALAVKELNSTEMASFMQCVMQPIGAVIGSLLFLQLVSGSLYIKLGLDNPLLNVNQYLVGLSALSMLSGLLIHLTYREKLSEQQKQNVKYSLWEVIKEYRYFVNPKYRLCRQCITFLIQSHGIIYFSSSFTVELIKKGIISKDMVTTISNILVIPVFFLTSILRRHWSNKQLIHKRTRIILFFRLVLMIILFVADFQYAIVLYIAIMILSLLSNSQFFLSSMICNDFTESKFAGMYVTMMASFTNFGNNNTIQLEIISSVGLETAVIFGFVCAAIVIALFGYIQTWIKNGISQSDNQYQKIQGKEH